MDYNIRAIFSAQDNGLSNAFTSAQNAAKGLESGVGTAMTNVGKGFSSAGKAMTVGFTLPLALGFKKAITSGVEFDSQMRRVKAISGATGSEFDQLREQAIKLGEATVFSATEVAIAQEGMASQGFETGVIMESMAGIMDLAAVSGGDLALSSQAVGQALNQFSMEGTQAGHVADVYARAAANSNAETDTMAQAMSYAGPIAGSLGMSIEETAASIGIMSNAGIIGSKAGMTLRTSLMRLASPTDEARELMDELGFSAFDSEGKLKPMNEILNQLQGSMAGMSDEQKQLTMDILFGKQSTAGMLALIDAAPGSFEEMTNSLINSDGAAAEMAETINSGLGGALTELKSALGTTAEKITVALEDTLQSVIEKITEVVRAFNSLDPAVQQNIVKAVLFVAALGPLLALLGSIGKLIGGVISGVSALSGAFTAVSTGTSLATVAGEGFLASVGGLAGALAPAAGAIASVAGVAIVLVGAFQLASTHSETFRDTLNNVFDNIKEAATGFGETVGEAFTRISRAVEPIKEAMSGLAEVVGGVLGQAFSTIASIIGGVVVAAFSILSSIVSAVAGVFEFLSPIIAGLINVLSGLASIIGAVLNPVLSIIGFLVQGVVTAISVFVNIVIQLAEALLSLLQPALDFIGEKIGKLGEIFETIGGGISKFTDKIGLTGQKTSEAMSGMSEASTISLDQVMGKTDEAAAATAVDFSSMKLHASEATESMSSSLLGTLLPTLSQLPEETKTMASGVIAQMQQMGVSSVAEANAMVSDIGIKWDEMDTWTEQDWANVKSTVSKEMAEASSAAVSNAESLTEGVGQNWSEISSQTDVDWGNIQSTVLEEIGASNINAVSEASQLNAGVSSEFSDLGYSVDGYMNDMSSTMDSSMSNISNSANSNLNNISKDFTSSFNDISQTADTSFNKLSTTTTEFFNKTKTATTTALNEITNQTKTALTQINTATTQSLNQINMAIKQSMTQFVTAIRQSMTNTVNAFRTGMQGAVQAVNSFRGAMYSAGLNLSYGLANGISAGRSAVISSAISVASSAISAARSRLAIHSPSRVFEEIGGYTSEGMAIGIEGKGRYVTNAIGGVVDKAIKKGSDLENAFDNNISSGFNSMVSTLNNAQARAMSKIGQIQKMEQNISIKSSQVKRNEFELHLQLGNRSFRAFTDDISIEQGQKAQLVEEFGY